jgi:hypothetical protein
MSRLAFRGTASKNGGEAREAETCVEKAAHDRWQLRLAFSAANFR